MMSEETFQIILAIIALFGGGGGLTVIANRRKTRAEAAKINAEAEAIKTKAEAEAARVKADAIKAIIGANKEILGEYRLRNDELERQLNGVKLDVKNLIEEQKLQDLAIENMNAKILKLELLNIIYVSQIRSFGVEPRVGPGEIGSISIEELRDIARSLIRIDRRKKKADDQEAKRDD